MSPGPKTPQTLTWLLQQVQVLLLADISKGAHDGQEVVPLPLVLVVVLLQQHLPDLGPRALVELRRRLLLGQDQVWEDRDTRSEHEPALPEPLCP